MKNSDYLTIKNNQKWGSTTSNQKKTMINNNLVQDLMLQPTDDDIISVDTLMRYVQGLMPLAERKVFEAEVLKEGNEFYIDAIKGLITSLNNEKGNANVVMNKLNRQAEENFSLFLMTNKEIRVCDYYQKYSDLKTTKDFAHNQKTACFINHKEILDNKKPILNQSLLTHQHKIHHHANYKMVTDTKESVLHNCQSVYQEEEKRYHHANYKKTIDITEFHKNKLVYVEEKKNLNQVNNEKVSFSNNNVLLENDSIFPVEQ